MPVLDEITRKSISPQVTAREILRFIDANAGSILEEYGAGELREELNLEPQAFLLRLRGFFSDREREEQYDKYYTKWLNEGIPILGETDGSDGYDAFSDVLHVVHLKVTVSTKSKRYLPSHEVLYPEQWILTRREHTQLISLVEILHNGAPYDKRLLVTTAAGVPVWRYNGRKRSTPEIKLPPKPGLTIPYHSLLPAERPEEVVFSDSLFPRRDHPLSSTVTEKFEYRLAQAWVVMTEVGEKPSDFLTAVESKLEEKLLGLVAGAAGVATSAFLSPSLGPYASIGVATLIDYVPKAIRAMVEDYSIDRPVIVPLGHFMRNTGPFAVDETGDIPNVPYDADAAVENMEPVDGARLWVTGVQDENFRLVETYFQCMSRATWTPGEPPRTLDIKARYEVAVRYSFARTLHKGVY